MGLPMLNIRNILDNVILEKWSPKNKKKHAACKAKVKAKVDVWPSAYASGQVVQCYYGEETEMDNLKKLFERSMTSEEMTKEKKLHKKIPKEPFKEQYGEEKGEDVYYATTKKMAMESTDCGCDGSDVIMEAVKKATEKIKKKKPRAKINRKGSAWFRHKVTGNLISRRGKGRRFMTSGEKRDVASIAAGLNMKPGLRADLPAETEEEKLYATAVKIAAKRHGNPVGEYRRGKTTKKSSGKKTTKKSSGPAAKSASVRDAMARIAAARASARR